MRTIKVRVWLVKEKKMLYDFRGWFDMPEGKIVCIETEDFYYTDSKPNNFTSFKGARFLEYTGLKDSKETKKYPKGQEIYEGDIVRYKSKNWDLKLIVGYAAGHFFIHGGNKERDKFKKNHEDLWKAKKIGSVKVIGNIYENN